MLRIPLSTMTEKIILSIREIRCADIGTNYEISYIFNRMKLSIVKNTGNKETKL